MKINIKLFYIIPALFLFTTVILAQSAKTDSIGNFYVIDNHLMWQKNYDLYDVNALDAYLKSNHFTSTLDILNYKTSAQSNLSYLDGNNLPQYTTKGFKAFIVIDIIQDRYRVTIRDIIFPDYIQTYYSNGFRDNRGGTLDHYILRQSDHEIKRNSGTYNILETFNDSFKAVFDSNEE
jgi:hypothetical protein